MRQVVEWPLLEVLLGQAGNFCPRFKNTTTSPWLPHLYGPLSETVPPVVPLALILLALVSLILVSLKLEVVFLQC
jgi:hypothetical protein